MRAVCQPPEIRARRNAEHWTASLFGRQFSIYLTRVAVWLGLSANAVTTVMILCGWAAATALLLPQPWGPIIACVLALGQMTIDAIDGEVARWRGTAGPHGYFLDRIAHTTTESAVPLVAGLSLALAASPVDWRWAALGGAASALVLVNKSLNDGLRIARANAGMPQLSDTGSARQIRVGLLQRARRAADFVPVHRLYHSVEQTGFLAFFAVLGVIFGFNGMGLALLILACALPVVIIGHATAILASSALTTPSE